MKYQYSIICICLFFSFLLFSNESIRSSVSAAVKGEYGKTAGGGVSLQDWNSLDNDFLLTDGTNMGNADLQMSSNQVSSLISGAGQNDAVNIDYVSTQMASEMAGVQGGDTYINWGRGDCASGDTVLYSGYGFGNFAVNASGGENEICISEPFDGSIMNSGSATDSLYPLMTGETVYFPTTDTSYQGVKFIKCAVCFRQKSSCYLVAGSHQCNFLDFVIKAYQGYLVGEIIENSVYKATSQNSCLNTDFDNSSGLGFLAGDVWRGASLAKNFGISTYPESHFIKCAICCN